MAETRCKRMAAKDSGEKIYTIPLRGTVRKSRLKRSQCAMGIIKKFIKTHTKAKTVKIGKNLNEKVWERSMEKPPRRVRVKAVVDGDIAKVELMGFEYVEFKAAPKKEKKGLQEKLLSRLGPKALQKEAEEKFIEGKKEEANETQIEAEAAKEIREEEREAIKEDIKKEKEAHA